MRAGLEDRTRKRNLFITEEGLIIYDTKFYVAIGRSAFKIVSNKLLSLNFVYILQIKSTIIKEGRETAKVASIEPNMSPVTVYPT